MSRVDTERSCQGPHHGDHRPRPGENDFLEHMLLNRLDRIDDKIDDLEDKIEDIEDRIEDLKEGGIQCWEREELADLERDLERAERKLDRAEDRKDFLEDWIEDLNDDNDWGKSHHHHHHRRHGDSEEWFI